MAGTLSTDEAMTTTSDLPTPVLDLPGLDDTLQPFGQSRMLPAAAYTSDDVLRWELRHLFAGTYTCVGREDELRQVSPDASPLTQRAVMVGDVHVVLTWSGASGDEVQAFANTCRHRAHELVEADGGSSKQSIVCPYHAWSYDLSGRLRAAPGYKDVPGFDSAEHGLVALPVHRWHGWLFVHAASTLADSDVVDFTSYIGDLEEIVAPYAPEALVLGDRHSYEVEANWKVLSENYHECYHCPLIHPELCQVSPPTSGENYDRPGAWIGGDMELREGMQTMSITGESGGRPIPGVSPTAVEYLGLLPNLLISAHPDYVMTHRLVPLSAGRTWVECSWYVPAVVDGPPIDPSYAVEFWDLTNKQDWAACESVQRGLASPHFKAGPFSPSEDAVHMFATTIARAYRGLPIHEPADYR
jgi:Rieske 2Fe-2S family protein